METKSSTLKNSEPEFAEFWINFKLIPWKWVDTLTGPGYLLGSTLFVYAVLAFLTYFPNNPWVAPSIIINPLSLQYLGNNQILLLKHYPSINIILIGWMLVTVLMIRWRRMISSTFQWLWDSKRIQLQDGRQQNEYAGYLRDYQNALLTKMYPFLISFLLIALFFSLALKANMFQFVLNFFTPLAAILLFIVLFTGGFWLFIIGQFSWILFITGVYIGKLTQRFDIEIQASHPDQCGGLKPLGDFCLDAAIPLIAGGLALALIPVLKADIDRVLSIMATTFIFCVVGPLTILTIFFPLWNIHSKMVENKKAYEDAFAVQAVELEQAIHANTRMAGNLTEAKDAKGKTRNPANTASKQACLPYVAVQIQ